MRARTGAEACRCCLDERTKDVIEEGVQGQSCFGGASTGVLGDEEGVVAVSGKALFLDIGHEKPRLAAFRLCLLAGVEGLAEQDGSSESEKQ